MVSKIFNVLYFQVPFIKILNLTHDTLIITGMYYTYVSGSKRQKGNVSIKQVDAEFHEGWLPVVVEQLLKFTTFIFYAGLR